MLCLYTFCAYDSMRGTIDVPDFPIVSLHVLQDEAIFGCS